MTTSNETLDFEETDQKERTIDELFGLSYSEMTDDEIERLTQYKIEREVKSKEMELMQEAIERDLQNKRDVYEAEAANSRELLNSLTEHAINRLKAESNG